MDLHVSPKTIKTFWLAVFVGGMLAILLFANLDRLRGKPDDGFGTVQLIGVLLGAGLFLLGGHFLFRRFSYSLYLFCFISGISLLSLNLYGEFVSLRNARVDAGDYHANKFRIPSLSYQQAIRQTDKLRNETNEEYAFRLTDVFYSATIHKWEDVTDYTEYNHQVPPHENYLMWALSYIDPVVYRYYQFCNPDKALERGVMICSQAAQAMVNLWQKNTGLKARIVVLEGHVVAEAQMEDTERWWVLDADFGVVLKYDVATLAHHPEIVVEHYLNAGYDDATVQKVAGIYGDDGNYIQTNAGICRTEKKLDAWKWYLPVLLLVPAPLYFGGSWWISRYRSRLQK